MAIATALGFGMIDTSIIDATEFLDGAIASRIRELSNVSRLLGQLNTNRIFDTIDNELQQSAGNQVGVA